jgi:hypothetical protein
MIDNDTDAKAGAMAHALVHGYLGPDHKVIDMAAFYSALVLALKEAAHRPSACSPRLTRKLRTTFF